MLQAYVDDSGRGNPPVFVLAGLIASAAAWADFSDEWDKTLKDDPRLDFLKMNKYMKLDPWRDENADIKLSKLYSLQGVINTYVEYGIVVLIPITDYREIFKEAALKVWKSEYYFTATNLISTIIEHEYGLGRKQTVDFIFDDQANEEAAVQLSWDRAKSGRVGARIRRRMGSLTYGSDHKIPQLQAADMVAWLYRKMAADMLGDLGDIFPECPEARGRPLYDLNTLYMGTSHAMSLPRNAKEITLADMYALTLRMSSKSWPGGKMLQIPIYGFHFDRTNLTMIRDDLIRKGALKLQPRLAGGERRSKDIQKTKNA